MTDRTHGQIVWHDFFTNHRPRAMAFYRHVAGWHYVIEHATNFAWGGGEKDFALALSGGEAGVGFAETPKGQEPGWLAYVEVRDVDSVAARASDLGGRVLRAPFDVPGVGRNALLIDPLGARIGLSQSSHSFPTPHRQFGAESYLSAERVFPTAFYAGLFGWHATNQDAADTSPGSITNPDGAIIAQRLIMEHPDEPGPLWLPGIKVSDIEAALHRAKALGAAPYRAVDAAAVGSSTQTVLKDPEGLLIRLVSG